MSANKLAANDDKTHLMVIRRAGKQEELTITVGKNSIKETQNTAIHNSNLWLQIIEKFKVIFIKYAVGTITSITYYIK